MFAVQGVDSGRGGGARDHRPCHRHRLQQLVLHPARQQQRRDDGIGSRFYVGIGARGTLASILDSSIGGTSFPSLAIPVVKVPPDIDGGAIFTLGNKSFTNQVMINGGVDGKHTYSFSLSQV